jgi:hypothetical protein
VATLAPHAALLLLDDSTSTTQTTGRPCRKHLPSAVSVWLTMIVSEVVVWCVWWCVVCVPCRWCVVGFWCVVAICDLGR